MRVSTQRIRSGVQAGLAAALGAAALGVPAAAAGTSGPVPAVGAPVAMAVGPRPERGQIIGGRPAAPGAFPFMATVLHRHPDGRLDYLCSGTLVAPDVVLTAGHCAASPITGAPQPASGFEIVTGAVNWSDGSGRQISRVATVIVDPAFRPAQRVGDAALLVLAAPVSAPAVQLWRGGRLRPGLEATIVGWGSTHSGQEADQTLLEDAPTKLQSTTYCAEQAVLDQYDFHPASELCVLDPPADRTGTCAGDSGGPLLIAGSDGRPLEVGLTSTGPDDCDTYAGDYFTAVGPIVGWIRRQIAAHASIDAPEGG